MESSLLLIILKTISDNFHDPELLTLTQGHQGKWNKKSCVSFEEECINRGDFEDNNNIEKHSIDNLK